MEKPEVKPAVCEVGQGTLPGCAALAFPYIPMQSNNPIRYSRTEALQTGTLFPGLDLPFKAAIQARTKLPNTALVELMALDFAVTELNLYLDTHPQDQEALGLYASYIKLAKEGGKSIPPNTALWTARSWFWRTATPGSMTRGLGS